MQTNDLLVEDNQGFGCHLLGAKLSMPKMPRNDQNDQVPI